jgi:hypothetical protein
MWFGIRGRRGRRRRGRGRGRIDRGTSNTKKLSAFSHVLLGERKRGEEKRKGKSSKQTKSNKNGNFTCLKDPDERGKISCWKKKRTKRTKFKRAKQMNRSV